ncbi:winged helix-turn-helix transcriptional regulator [Klenkia taihuensis]|uniref:Transcriptional regulator, HxlR family n=1 Tax=Klenkia taihuensis TaxID=1225127 RepID=A0A1I1V7M5_9ACTN|nr:helix-turn-helix domain-containing protein [Klenkia taihuensis]GHE14475.1 HxlR family transcriptional regulator [Klenkia taihuensis]SFD79017.1 transcriptional regulator, HxlR family [Klenkia taihuensis]
MHERSGTPAGGRDDVESLAADVFSRACTSREALEHVTGKWSLLALSALQEAPHRFGELRRRVDGVSEKMLSQSLQTLERDGWVHREVRSTIPPHVEYRLTPAGAELAPKLLALIGFVEDRLPEVHAARDRHDAAR